jgi:hypothetical protein
VAKKKVTQSSPLAGYGSFVKDLEFITRYIADLPYDQAFAKDELDLLDELRQACLGLATTLDATIKVAKRP